MKKSIKKSTQNDGKQLIKQAVQSSLQSINVFELRLLQWGPNDDLLSPIY